MSDLIILLNQRTKHIIIKNHQKKKPLSVYLKSVYGSFINFLDNYTLYGICYTNTGINVILFDKELSANNIDKSILKEYREWTLIENDDFILI